MSGQNSEFRETLSFLLVGNCVAVGLPQGLGAVSQPAGFQGPEWQQEETWGPWAGHADGAGIGPGPGHCPLEEQDALSTWPRVCLWGRGLAVGLS